MTSLGLSNSVNTTNAACANLVLENDGDVKGLNIKVQALLRVALSPA